LSTRVVDEAIADQRHDRGSGRNQLLGGGRRFTVGKTVVAAAGTFGLPGVGNVLMKSDEVVTVCRT